MCLGDRILSVTPHSLTSSSLFIITRVFGVLLDSHFQFMSSTILGIGLPLMASGTRGSCLSKTDSSNDMSTVSLSGARGGLFSPLLFSSSHSLSLLPSLRVSWLLHTPHPQPPQQSPSSPPPDSSQSVGDTVILSVPIPLPRGISSSLPPCPSSETLNAINKAVSWNSSRKRPAGLHVPLPFPPLKKVTLQKDSNITFFSGNLK